jgi:LuxR family transcriptional regulator, maltose regulon positive regulatory protein
MTNMIHLRQSAAPPAGLDVRQQTLTRTKLVPPRLPSLPVALERHQQWIPAVLTHSLTLVRAPSGFGKSTICTAWYNAFMKRGCHVSWISFEREDDDCTRAISYIVQAVHQSLPAHARTAGFDDGFMYDGLIPPQSIAAHFINAIHDVNGHCVLFLDDFDRLTDPRILQFINYVLLHCPDNLHLVISCQAQPALPLVYLDTHGMLLRVDTEELRLSDAEARDLLAGGGTVLRDDEIHRLNTAMAGWVTGLRIGSAALRNNRDALFDIGLVSHGAHWLSDYLDENIFQHLTTITRRFLMRCAIVETMNAEICQALSGEQESARMLTWLADQNLFIQRLDDAGNWFRIHPVFREFLLARLVGDDPAAIIQLHKKASHWFARHDRLAEAIGHALEAGAAEEAADLIDIAAMPMVDRSDIITLLGWIARLPEAVIADRLPIRLAEAWALTLSLRPQARSLLDVLSDRVGTIKNDGERADLQRELAGIETVFLAVYEDRLDAALEHGYAFLQSPPNEDSFVARAVRNATAYCELHRGNHHLVHELVRPAQLHAIRNEQLFTTAYRHCVIGTSYRAQGQLAEAERAFRVGLDLAEQRSGYRSASSALVAAFLARSLYERNDLDGATALLNGRMPIIDEACYHEASINAYLVSVRAAALRGRTDDAAALIEHAELIGHERKWHRLLATCIVERRRLGLPQTMDAEMLVPAASEECAIENPLSLAARTFAILAEARVYDAMTAGNHARVAEITARLDLLAMRAGSLQLSLRANLLSLLPIIADSDSSAINGAIVSFLNQAARSGFCRKVIDVLGIAGLEKLQKYNLSARISSEFLMRVDQANLPRNGMSQTNTMPGTSGTVFSILTSREIDVLTGVGRGDSNKEIARQLHLTPETVKWHLKNVMRKLSVDSRAEAVRRAAEIGLSLTVD